VICAYQNEIAYYIIVGSRNCCLQFTQVEIVHE
jgi:hypothetical protein